MTAHIHSRKTTAVRPHTADRTTPAIPTTPSPKRPRPRWAGPVGVAAAVLVAGIGTLAFDANSQPTSGPAPIENPAVIGNGQVQRPGLPDGYWQPENASPSFSAAVGETPVLRAGQRPQPGMPDGYWQQATAEPSAAQGANLGCKISGPC